MFAWRLFVQIKRRLLWRVRRKLILSYIFIGVIPSLLILVFFLFAGSLVFMNVSAYLFKDGYDAIVDSARLSAQAAATEIARNPASAERDDRARPPDPRPRCIPASRSPISRRTASGETAGSWRAPAAAGVAAGVAARGRVRRRVRAAVKGSPTAKRISSSAPSSRSRPAAAAP